MAAVAAIPPARMVDRMGVHTAVMAAIQRRRTATVVRAAVITVAQAAEVFMAARVVGTARVPMEAGIAKPD